MRFKTRNLLLLTVLLLVAGGLATRLWRKPEPSYQGRPLSSWFRQYCRWRWSTAERTEAQLALRALGTNAVPYLLKECFSSPDVSPLSTNVSNLMNALRRPLGLPEFISPEELQSGAGDALKELKPPAEFVLPYVTNAFAQPRRDLQCRALFVLGVVGDNASATVPWLKRGLQSQDWWQRVLAVQSVSWLGPAAQETVPDLLHLLTNPPVQAAMVQPIGKALGSIGPGAAAAPPALQDRLAMETNLTVRLVLAGALCRIAPEQTNALAEIVQEVRGTLDTREYSGLLFELGNIGPSARVAVPFLRELLANPRTAIWYPAAQALERIGADKDLVVTALLPKLQERSENIQYNAASRILAREPSNAPAQAVLMRLIQNKSPYTALAISDLAKTGAAARPALPLLRDLSLHGDQVLRKTAALSLRQIETSAP